MDREHDREDSRDDDHGYSYAALEWGDSHGVGAAPRMTGNMSARSSERTAWGRAKDCDATTASVAARVRLPWKPEAARISPAPGTLKPNEATSSGIDRNTSAGYLAAGFVNAVATR